MRHPLNGDAFGARGGRGGRQRQTCGAREDAVRGELLRREPSR